MYEVTAATCYTKGYTTRTCTKCGTVSVLNVLEPLGHSFVNGICINCGEKMVQDTPFEFDDVKDSSKFYYTPVYWAYSAKPQITNGKSATTFVPNATCNRGEAVTFLYRAAGK